MLGSVRLTSAVLDHLQHWAMAGYGSAYVLLCWPSILCVCCALVLVDVRSHVR